MCNFRELGWTKCLTIKWYMSCNFTSFFKSFISIPNIIPLSIKHLLVKDILYNIIISWSICSKMIKWCTNPNCKCSISLLCSISLIIFIYSQSRKSHKCWFINKFCWTVPWKSRPKSITIFGNSIYSIICTFHFFIYFRIRSPSLFKYIINFPRLKCSWCSTTKAKSKIISFTITISFF